jgi:DNA-binding NarL/FixJ family response regulator
MSCRILLADDHEVVRSGLKAVLRFERDITICGEASDGMDAIRQANQLRPDIIIADPWLPGANGIVLTAQILERCPKQKILIFGTFESASTLRDLLLAGVKGVVLKTDPAADILGAISALRRDRTYFTSSIESVILHDYLRPAASVPSAEALESPLTLREQEVAQLLAEGRATKEIGTMLGISHKTAATHRSNLMRKAGVHNVAEITRYAISHRLIEVPVFRPVAEVIELRRPDGRKAAKAAA